MRERLPVPGLVPLAPLAICLEQPIGLLVILLRIR